jgi:hypothetical protein
MKRLIDNDTTVNAAAVDAACAALTASVAADAKSTIATAAALAANKTFHERTNRLCEIDQAALHGAIVGMLVDEDIQVRNTAMAALFKIVGWGDWLVPTKVLGNIKPVVLVSHAGFMVSMLERTDATDARMRSRALKLIQITEVAMQTPSVLALVCNALTNTMLTDDYEGLRREAQMTLASLKPHYHWAKVRTFVKNEYLIRTYARFWYEHAGKHLCAPGGKWAVRDCALFEAEFNDRPSQ